MSAWRQMRALIGKDLALERRGRESLAVMLVFGLLVVLILSFAFDLRVEDARQAVPGALWVALAFAGVLGLSRSQARDLEDACIEGLTLAPVPRSTLYLSKATANLLCMAGSAAVILPVSSVLFAVNVVRLDLAVVVLLGLVGLAGLGTLLAAVAVQTPARELLLPVLLLPASVPLLVATSNATAGVLDGTGLAGVRPWLGLVGAFDVIFVAASCALFEYVMEE